MSLPAAIAAQGRWLLIAGLVLGIALPGLARAMTPAIVPLIALMLCIAALREGPRAAFPTRRALPRALAVTVLLQTALPLAAALLCWGAGWLTHPLAIAAVLAMAASPITGAPGLAVLSGADAGAALRQLSLGTALLPLTALPVFAVLPLFPGPGAIFVAAGQLFLIVLLAVGLAAVLRRAWPGLGGAAARPSLDAAMAVAMGLVVIGLMSEIGPALSAAPAGLAGALALAFALHAGQSMGGWYATRRSLPRAEATSTAIVAGNRNMALFLAAVPPETIAPLMVFVGCYQIPMYLTPFMIGRLRKAG